MNNKYYIDGGDRSAFVFSTYRCTGERGIKTRNGIRPMGVLFSLGLRTRIGLRTR